MDTSEAYIVYVDEGGSDFFFVDDPFSDNVTLRYVGNGGEVEYWSHNVVPEIEGNGQNPVQISRTADGIIMCEGTQWVLLDSQTGEVLDNHGKDCDLGLRYEFATEAMDETCDGKDPSDGATFQDWRIMHRAFEPIGFYNDGDGDPVECMNWARTFPEPFDGTNILFFQEIGTELFTMVTH